MASETSVCNSALTKLGAARINSRSDGSKNARACDSAFDRVRDMALRKHPWNFAITRAQLAADVTAPLFDYAASYTIPSDCLRILPPNDYRLDWHREGDAILTNQGAPLNLRYVKRVTDVNAMDALFQEVLAYELAEDLCELITQSNTQLQLLHEGKKELLAEAKRTNAIEQVSQELPEDDWIAVRYGGGSDAVYYSGGW